MPAATDYIVKDISLAGFGRKEINMAEDEMPGLMATRAEFGPSQPLKGARVAGCLHMTIQTAVLIETLTALGAEVRWSSCNIFSTQDHAAAAIAVTGVPVFAVKGETLEEYWDYVRKTLEWATAASPNMLLDDGGDMTLLVHYGLRAEQGDVAFLDKRGNDEETVFFALIKKCLAEKPGWFAELAASIKGVSEETTTGRAPPLQHGKDGKLLFPAINVNDSVTKSKFDNLYGCRESLVDAIRRGTDVMMAGKIAMVAGFGRRGQGLRRLAAQRRLPRDGERGRPDLRAAGRHGGLRGGDDGGRAPRADIFVTATGNVDVITGRPHARDEAPRHRVQHRPLRQRDPGRGAQEPQVGQREAAGGRDRVPRRQAHHPAQRRPPGEPRQRHRPPVLRHVGVLHQPDARPDRAVDRQRQYERKVYVLPKHLDEKVAMLHLDKVGAKLTKLRAEQASYIGVPTSGPFKAEAYRY
jgi:adenosylhomocysteinase